MTRFLQIILVSISVLSFAGSARADCVNPAAPERKLIYNQDYHVVQFCNGTNWIAAGPIGTVTSTSTCPADLDAATVCPAGFFVGVSGTCYKKLDYTAYTWANGQSACQALGANMVTVSSAAENAYLVSEGIYGYWLAFSDTATEGTFVWTGSTSTYTNWAGGEPNDADTGGEDCATIDSGGTWNDIQCGGTRPVLCEKVAGTSVTCTDATPLAFSFTDRGAAAASVLTTSIIVQIVGISGNVPVSISGSSGEYRICTNYDCSAVAQTWNSGSSTISPGQFVQLRLTSSGTPGTVLSTVLAVGAASDQWSVTTCSGASVGGGCWYYGAVSQSCDTVCANASLVYDASAQSYADNPNTANCQAVLDALAAPGTGAPGASACSYGCSARSTGVRRLCTNATTSTSSSGTYQRACACR